MRTAWELGSFWKLLWDQPITGYCVDRLNWQRKSEKFPCEVDTLPEQEYGGQTIDNESKADLRTL
jgi:hypothetical protein